MSGIRARSAGVTLPISRGLEVLFMLDNVVPTASASSRVSADGKSHGSLDADIIIKNAPDPIFIS
ncbi:MAG TPA: hypothetical protein VEP90_10975, partial [Methylomirabilota bacterium]|nr:hypothetical protein [Methylomirabilota bacterium]